MSWLRECLTAEVELRANVPGLGRMGVTYSCLPDLLTREGTAYEPGPYDAARWGPPGEPQKCFRNAFRLAARWGELVYVEGLALAHGGVIPVVHAWTVELATLRVVDPTWDDGVGGEYLGIPFDLDFVDERTNERGIYGVLDDWQNDWPLCQAPLDPMIVVAAARRQEGER